VGGRRKLPTTISAIAVFPDYSNLLGPSSALFQPGTLNGVAKSGLHRGKYGSKTGLGQSGAACRLCLDAALRPEESGGPHARQRAVDGHPRQLRHHLLRRRHQHVLVNGSNKPRAITTAPSAAGQRFRRRRADAADNPAAVVAFPLNYTEVWPQSDFTFGSTGFSTMKDKLQLPSVQAFNIGVQREISRNTVDRSAVHRQPRTQRLAHL